MKNLLKVVLVLAVAAGLTACHKNVKNDANDETVVTVSETVVSEEDVEIPAQEVALGVVHFDLDKATLSADNRKIVEANAQAIKAAASSVSNYQVVVEGNCDDRGTTAYNIALGQSSHCFLWRRKTGLLRSYPSLLGPKPQSRYAFTS